MPAPTLLHLDASILGAQSATRALSAARVERLRAQHPGLGIAYRDLAAQPLPHFQLPAPNPDPVLAEFLGADIVVIGVPMYNFAIPSQLKAWIDRIAIAGKTFRYRADGTVEGLASGKQVHMALAAGGNHPIGAAPNFVEPYLRFMLGFLGITDIHVVRANGLALSPGIRQTAMDQALERARNGQEG